MTNLAPPLDHPTLPGVRQRTLHTADGLSVRILEAGFETPGRPAVLLLHGFPETAHSWRGTLRPLADAGYHVIAPDQRGYGATTGWHDADVASFRTHAFARDALGVVSALGLRSVAAVVGHDFGSMVAAYCALVRPDVFRSLAMTSFPFDGPPAIPSGDAPRPPALDAQLAALPRPRKDSMAFFSGPGAEADMLHPHQGLHAFLRAYYHVKSADWPGNRPRPLSTGSAEELSTLPTYYIMDRAAGMAATVAPHMPSPAEIAANRWLPDKDLAVHARAIDRMRTTTCTRMAGVHLVEGAGHWVQQEQPERFNEALLAFLRQTGR